MAENTQAQAIAAQNAQNLNFMTYSHEQYAKAFAQNDNTYRPAKTLNFVAPIITNAYAHKLILKHKLKITPTGNIAPTAGYPYNLVSRLGVEFGNKVVDIHPYIAKLQEELEGRNTEVGTFAQTRSNSSVEIDKLLSTVPTTFETGVPKDVIFNTVLDLNLLNEQSVLGILPIFTSGTKLQVKLELPVQLIGLDPLDNPFYAVDGEPTVQVEGTVEIEIGYRDHKTLNSSMVAIQPDISGLPSLQMIELPQIALTGSNVWNHMSIKNPYKFVQIVNIVIDGLQKDKFSTVPNISGFGLDSAENSTAVLFRYDGIEELANYYHQVRETYARDFDSGVFIFDAPTMNQEDVNNRLGKNYLGLDTYTAARYGFKVKAIGESSTGVSPRVVSFGVIVNPAGIATV